MSVRLTDKEEVLVEFVYFLSSGKIVKDSSGDRWHESGASLQEIKSLLNKSIKSKNGETMIQNLNENGREFLNELKIYINKKEKFKQQLF